MLTFWIAAIVETIDVEGSCFWVQFARGPPGRGSEPVPDGAGLRRDPSVVPPPPAAAWQRTTWRPAGVQLPRPAAADATGVRGHLPLDTDCSLLSVIISPCERESLS